MARERWGPEAVARARTRWREEPAIGRESTRAGPTLVMDDNGRMNWEYAFEDNPETIIAAGAAHREMKTWQIAADYTSARIAVEGTWTTQPVRMHTHGVRTGGRSERVAAMERVLRESAPEWDR